MSPASVRIGDRLGPYEIVSPIGAGSSGRVFEARHSVLDRKVAIKVLDDALVSDAEHVSRFFHEAKLVNAVRHPNIIDITDFIYEQEPRRVALVMELLHGEALGSAISDGPFTYQQSINAGGQILDALSAVHAGGAIHRDLKPDNVFLLESRDTDLSRIPSIKVLDFGIAKIPTETAHKTDPGTVLGTPAYMAPEQLVGAEAGPATDLYAWAELLLEMMTGRRVFEGGLTEIMKAKTSFDLRVVVPDLPERGRPLLELLHRMLAIEPGRRPKLGEARSALASAGAVLHAVASRCLLSDGSSIQLFDRPSDAVERAVQNAQERRSPSLNAEANPAVADVEGRSQKGAAVHIGALFTDAEEPSGPGLTVATVLGSVARPGQVLVSKQAADGARRSQLALTAGQELEWVSHGDYRCDGHDGPLEVFQVGLRDGSQFSPPEASDRLARWTAGLAVEGWRPALQLEVPQRPRWRLVQSLARTAAGEIWLGRHLDTGEQRAFKFCFDGDRLMEMKREVSTFRILRDVLGHRADIIRIHECRFDISPPFIEMDYLPGGDLTNWAAVKGGLASISVTTRTELVAKIADAVAAAHAVGVIHRNLKPSNILIEDRKGAEPRVVVSDFGLSSSSCMSGGVLAADTTAERQMYVAPETLMGEYDTIQTDMFALGVLLYQVARADLECWLDPSWPQSIADEHIRGILLRLLNPVPEARPADARDVAAWLRGRHLDDQRLESAVNRPLPERIGPYRIVREVGRGGMGVVYEAEQESPRRRVAVKVLLSELSPEHALRRFEHEALILGRLRHPGVAHVYEAGTWNDGRTRWPFFAMEFIEGDPLDVYVANRSRSPADTLRLVAEIADAVQHAHQNGIIHRDLKPANILVTEEDGRPRPKVLDFGVARLLNEDSPRTTRDTKVGQIVGTVAYMSPEQLAGEEDVDTRTDVYALGTLLYLAMVRRLPFAVEGKPIYEVARMISQAPPKRLGQIDPSLRGDIEIIAAKALEKHREDRYASAADFALDIRRHLNYEPIAAHAPSLTYQLKKFAKRRRGFVAGLVATLASLLVGLTMATYGFVTATRERDAKIAALEQEHSARQVAEAVTSFLGDMMAAARPTQQGRDVSLQRVLALSESKIAAKFREQPQVRARLHATLGRTYLALGLYDRAETHVRAAVKIWNELVGPADRRTLEAHTMLGELLYFSGDLNGAAEAFGQVLEAARQLVPGDPQLVAEALGSVGFVAMRRGRHKVAERYLLEARRLSGEMVEDPPYYFDLLSNLAVLYTRMHRFEDAEPIYRTLIDRSRRFRGPKNPTTLLAMANLAAHYNRTDRPDRSIPLLKEALAGQKEVLGDSHSKTLITVNNLAVALSMVDRSSPESIQLLSEGLRTAREAYGDKAPSTLMFLYSLGRLQRERGNLRAADPFLAEHRKLSLELYGRTHLNSVKSLAQATRLRVGQKRFEEAAKLAQELMEDARAALPASQNDLAAWALIAVRAYKGAGRIEDARSELSRTLKLVQDSTERERLSEALVAVSEETGE